MIRAPIPTITMPATIWPVTRARANPVVAVMSPNPTVENTVMVKYKASVRVRGSLKLRAEIPPMTKYVAANSSRNSGTLVARAPTARSAGYVALMIERT
jgi:hypothetical protein